MPVRKDINFNSGFTGCNDRMAILKNETVPRKLDTFTEINPTEINTDMFVYVDDGESKKIRLGNIINTTASQADWAEEDESSYSYIRNKPADLALDKDLISLYNVGGIKAGQKFEAGTSLKDIIVALLSFTAGASGIYFGLVDHIDLEEIKNYRSIEGKTWPEVYLSQISDKIELDSIMNDGLTVLVANVDKNTEEVTPADNQYYVLAVPHRLGIRVDQVLQDKLSLDFKPFYSLITTVNLGESSEGATDLWDIYLPTKKTYPDGEAAEFAPTTGTYEITYKFVRGFDND